jgi:hypothetical protein
MFAALAGSPSVSPTISSMGLTVDPALLVDLVDDHVGHQFGRGADKRGRTGQVEKGSDLDRILGSHAAPEENQHQYYSNSRQSIHPFHPLLLLHSMAVVA